MLPTLVFLQWTPMHAAAKEGHEYTVKTLAKKGADINIKDKDDVSNLQDYTTVRARAADLV